MANKSKQIGTRAETKVVKFLRSYGYGARRKALAGNKDEGDVELFDAPRLCKPITLEIKAGKQTANPNRTQLEEWIRQARVEAARSGEDKAYLCVVRYNRKIEDADVWSQYFDFDSDYIGIIRHQYLDEFAEFFK